MKDMAATKEEAIKLIKDIGFPVIIRPSFTMGGTGGSTAYNIEEFSKQIELGLSKDDPKLEKAVENLTLSNDGVGVGMRF